MIGLALAGCVRTRLGRVYGHRFHELNVCGRDKMRIARVCARAIVVTDETNDRVNVIRAMRAVRKGSRRQKNEQRKCDQRDDRSPEHLPLIHIEGTPHVVRLSNMLDRFKTACPAASGERSRRR
jgi:hypothetical protein